jgi:hypothetical protein
VRLAIIVQVRKQTPVAQNGPGYLRIVLLRRFADKSPVTALHLHRSITPLVDARCPSRRSPFTAPPLRPLPAYKVVKREKDRGWEVHDLRRSWRA